MFGVRVARCGEQYQALSFQPRYIILVNPQLSTRGYVDGSILTMTPGSTPLKLVWATSAMSLVLPLALERQICGNDGQRLHHTGVFV